MAICPLPWFPIYAGELLGDEDFLVWSPAARGCWISLSARCWRDGSIPDDLDAIARLCGETDAQAMLKHWSSIATKFEKHESMPGRLISPRIEEERAASIAKAEKLKERGKAGATKRWMEKKEMPKHCLSNAKGMLTDASLPSPSTTSSLRSEVASCTEADEPPAVPPPLLPLEPAVLSLPCVGKGPKEWPVTQRQMDQWAEAFPGVVILAEVRKMRLWLLDPSHATRRKTYKGTGAFVLNWLGKAQNQGPPANGRASPLAVGTSRTHAADEALTAQIKTMQFPTLASLSGGHP